VRVQWCDWLLECILLRDLNVFDLVGCLLDTHLILGLMCQIWVLFLSGLRDSI